MVRIDDLTGAGFTTFGTSGSGNGNLSSPLGVTLDSLGRIYIADCSNQRIVRVDSMAGGGFTSFSGAGAQALSQPFAIAIH